MSANLKIAATPSRSDDKKPAAKKPSITVVPQNSPRANLLAGKEWLQHSFSVWRGVGKNGEEKKLRHPAMFTVALVERILDAYACGRGVLLDPFAGSGTALIAAAEKNMRAVGVDINPQFKKMFERRKHLLSAENAGDYHTHDARRLTEIVPPKSVDICITSPPYWDILNRKRTADGKAANPYSTMKSDLGNIDSYGVFMESLGEVVAQVRTVLKDGAPFVLNVMDLRKGKDFYPLHLDATVAAQKNGFVLDDIIIWDRQNEYNNMRPLGYPRKFIINKVHEYLLIFR